MVNIGANGNRAEADRWLVTSEKLLASNDLHGAKTFAIRACESDPTRAEAADYILAICDILIAGSLRLPDSNLPDWYSVLRLGRLTQNPEHVATQYRRLALLLNPSVNRLPFADKAFSLVSDAWRVLSDPSRKSAYDRELQLSQLGAPSRLGQPSQLGGSDPNETSFWTACPYCFVLFEYAKGYEECVLKCQDCKRAFQAVRIQKPPVIEGEGEDVYFCSWSVFPLGFSGEFQPPPRRRTSWSPISPLFACPKKRKEPDSPRIFYDDDDVYVAISDEEEDEEVQVNKKGKEKEPVVRRGVDSSSSDVMCKPVSGSSSRKGSSGEKNVGRLDLNEEPGVAGGRREGSGVGSSREVDNIIEGIGFFEGLDEFLMSMPILSVVGDDKIKAT